MKQFELRLRVSIASFNWLIGYEGLLPFDSVQVATQERSAVRAPEAFCRLLYQIPDDGIAAVRTLHRRLAPCGETKGHDRSAHRSALPAGARHPNAKTRRAAGDEVGLDIAAFGNRHKDALRAVIT